MFPSHPAGRSSARRCKQRLQRPWNARALRGSEILESRRLLAGVIEQFPFLETFDDLAPSEYWEFEVQEQGQYNVAENYPYTESPVLVLSSGYSQNSLAAAKLQVDLIDDSGAVRDARLDFAFRGRGRYGRVELRSAIDPHWTEIIAFSHIQQENHIAIDLKRSIGEQNVSLSDPFEIRFVAESNWSEYAAAHYTLDMVNIALNGNVVGPRVESVALLPSADAMPGNTMEVIFSEAVSLGGPTDLQFRLPWGEIIPPISITSDDGIRYLVEVPDMTSPGRYALQVHSTVQSLRDSTPLNQDGDSVLGELRDDRFVMPFHVPVLTSRKLPVVEDFDVDSIRELNLDVDASDGYLDMYDWYASGDSVLVAQYRDGDNCTYVSWLIDLSDVTPNQPVVMDLQVSLTEDATLQVEVSDDGQMWFASDAIGGDQWRALLANPTHVVFDLSDALRRYDIPADRATHVRICMRPSHSDFRSEPVGIDNVRISTNDYLGPYVEQTLPVETDGNIVAFTLAFSEAIDPNSLGTANVSFYDPLGRQLEWIFPPHDVDQGRRFRFDLTQSTAIRGDYIIDVRPRVRDLNGNPLNQNRDPLNGIDLAVGANSMLVTDRYQQVVRHNAAPVSFPFFERFSTDDPNRLLHWELQSDRGTARLEAPNPEAPTNYRLRFLDRQSATIPLLLDSIRSLDDVGFRFSVQGAVSLAFSIDRVHWEDYPIRFESMDKLAAFGVPLNQWFDSFSGGLSAEIGYLRFTNIEHEDADGANAVEPLLGDTWIDDIRLLRGDHTGPHVLRVIPGGELPVSFSQLTLQFSEPMSTATVTAQRIHITDPLGRRVAIDRIEPDAESQVFVVYTQAMQRIAGRYQVEMFPGLKDLAGNPLDQDRDGANGERPHDVYSDSLQLEPTPQTIPARLDFNQSLEDSLQGAIVENHPPGYSLLQQRTTDPANRQLVFKPDNGGPGETLIVAVELQKEDEGQPLQLAMALLKVSTSQIAVEWGLRADSAWHPIAILSQAGLNVVEIGSHLATAWAAGDPVVYLRLRPIFGDNRIIVVDNIEIGDLDAIGPQVVETTWSTDLSVVTVRFSNPVQLRTVNQDSIRLIDPLGHLLPMLDSPVAVREDSATIQLRFATRRPLPGLYRLLMNELIQDLHGDHAELASNGLELSTNLFTVATMQAIPNHSRPSATVPIDQSFADYLLEESGTWQFQSLGGSIDLVMDEVTQRQYLRMAPATEVTLTIDRNSIPRQTYLRLNIVVPKQSKGEFELYLNGVQQASSWHEDQATMRMIVFHFPSESIQFSSDIDSQIRIVVPYGTPESVELARIVFSESDNIGPNVVAPRHAAQTVFGVLDHLDVTFDRPIRPGTFDATEVSITNPRNEPVTLVQIPIELGDGRSFRIQPLQAQTIPGSYEIRIAPGAEDSLGKIAMYIYVYQVTLVPSAASQRTVPIYESFEVPRASDLPGWGFTEPFYASNTPADVLAREGLVYGSMTGTTSADSTFRPILAIDLSSEVNREDLIFSFWTTLPYPGIEIFDGTGEYYGGSSVKSNSGMWYFWEYDFDLLLRADRETIPDEVYVRFDHVGLLDDVRLYREAEPISERQNYVAPAHQVLWQDNRVTGLLVTPGRRAEIAQFASDRVAIWDPLSRPVPLRTLPIVRHDGTIEYQFSEPLEMSGAYRLALIPYNHGLGTALSSDGGAWPAEAMMTFVVEHPLVPRQLPYFESFEDTDRLTPSEGWRFPWSDQAATGIVTVDEERVLRIKGINSSDNAIIVAIDLQDQSSAELSFNYRFQHSWNVSTPTLTLSISDDVGRTWHPILGSYINVYQELTMWGQYSVDIIEALRFEHLRKSEHVQIKVQYSPPVDPRSDRDFILIDELRISADGDGPSVLDYSPRALTQHDTTPFDHISIVFDEPVSVGSTLESLIESFAGPVGDLRPQVTHWNLEDNVLTFWFPPQTVSGTYELVLSANLRDRDWNALDVDRDGLDGERRDDRVVATVYLANTMHPDGPTNFSSELSHVTDSSWSFYSPNNLVHARNGQLVFPANLQRETSEAVLHLDLRRARTVQLSFDRHGGEMDRLSSDLRPHGSSLDNTTHSPASYIAVSDNGGARWYVIDTFQVNGHIVIDIDKIIAWTSVKFSDHFMIKFAAYVPAGRAETMTIDNIVVNATFPYTSLVGRHVIYRYSAYDMHVPQGDIVSPALPLETSELPGIGKRALLPGDTASFMNYTSYSRGINAIAVDLSYIGIPAAIDAEDFVFRIGNSEDMTQWQLAPAPQSITVSVAAGIGGSDRIVVTWEDNVIQNTWLQVTVRASADTRMVKDDIHYWGNLIGETGDQFQTAVVDQRDEEAIWANYRAFDDPPEMDNPYDLNRDRKVDTADVMIARRNRAIAQPLARIVAPRT